MAKHIHKDIDIDDALDQLVANVPGLFEELTLVAAEHANAELRGKAIYVLVLYSAATRAHAQHPQQAVDQLQQDIEFLETHKQRGMALLCRAWQAQIRFRELSLIEYPQAISELTSLVETAIADSEASRIFEIKLIAANISIVAHKPAVALRWLESVEQDLSNYNFYTKSLYFGSCGITFSHLNMLDESSRSFEYLLSDSRIRFYPTMAAITSVNLVENHFRAGQYEKTIEAIKKAEARQSEVDLIQGKFYLKTRQIKTEIALGVVGRSTRTAVLSVRAAAQLTPSLGAVSLLILAQYLQARGKLRSTLSVLKAMGEAEQADLSPEEQMDFYRIRGECGSRLGDLALALPAYQTLSRLQSDFLAKKEALLAEAITSKISMHYTKNHTMFLEEQLNTEIGLKNHTLREFKKLLFTHQVQEIYSGKCLEETMPQQQGYACVLSFDVQNSASIGHSKYHDFFETLFRGCHGKVREGYHPESREARAFMIKELGDGFLCSVGFPFGSTAQSIHDAAVRLAFDFIDTLDHVSKLFLQKPAHCSIAIVSGDINGYFPKFGVKNYELYGDPIVLATRYEGFRKILNAALNIENEHTLIIHEDLQAKLQPSLCRYFKEFVLDTVQVRDDPSAKRLFYLHRRSESDALKVS